MPTYDFVCMKCERETEKNVPISKRDDLYECEFCGGALERMLSFQGLTWAPTAGGMR